MSDKELADDLLHLRCAKALEDLRGLRRSEWKQWQVLFNVLTLLAGFAAIWFSQRHKVSEKVLHAQEEELATLDQAEREAELTNSIFQVKAETVKAIASTRAMLAEAHEAETRKEEAEDHAKEYRMRRDEFSQERRDAANALIDDQKQQLELLRGSFDRISRYCDALTQITVWSEGNKAGIQLMERRVRACLPTRAR